jgi:predicted enzyme related to lactoylglutathione lyase
MKRNQSEQQTYNQKENKMSSNSVNAPNMKLEVVLFNVSDVDRAKAFYENLGWRFDIDVVEGDFRGVHFTPPNSDASILFGKGVAPANSGSVQNLVLGVDDLDTARKDLIDRGVNVSEIFHYAGGPFNNAVENSRVSGRDSQGRSYFSRTYAMTLYIAHQESGDRRQFGLGKSRFYRKVRNKKAK